MRPVIWLSTVVLVAACARPGPVVLESPMEPVEDEGMGEQRRFLTGRQVVDFHDVPVIIAHRGASGRAPENTITAYRKAVELGAEVAEVDVHMSADGDAIAIHDATLDRTTDGEGRVDEASTALIQSVDAGRWKDVKYLGERVPTLAEVLSAVGEQLILCVELKDGDGLVERVLADVTAAGLKDRVVYFSFKASLLREVREVEAFAPIVLLIDTDARDHENFQAAVTSAGAILGADALGVSRRIVDEALVEASHSEGLPLFVFTVNRPADIAQLFEWGVDGIITDRPDIALRVVVDGALN